MVLYATFPSNAIRKATAYSKQFNLIKKPLIHSANIHEKSTMCQGLFLALIIPQ